MSGAIPLFPLYMWLGQEQLLPFMISGTYTEKTNPITYQSTPAKAQIGVGFVQTGTV